MVSRKVRFRDKEFIHVLTSHDDLILIYNSHTYLYTVLSYEKMAYLFLYPMSLFEAAVPHYVGVQDKFVLH